MKPKNSADNFGRCRCVDCPLYVECNRRNAERLFCARARSECPMDKNKTCVCLGCPVHEENKLTGLYYCLQGPAE